MSEDADLDDAAPGWDAIDAALRPIYGKQEPRHFGTIVKHRLGGPDPLDGISVYERDDGTPHWHFVSYGLSELYQKETEDPESSGYGFELTFRLAIADGEDEPPPWALNLLQNLARYVFKSGNVFAPGHHMTLNGPIALDRDTQITAALFVADPELPAIDTPHGRLAFVQLVGITGDELEAAQGWNSDGLGELLAAGNPLLVTDLARKSLLADAATARTIAERSEREGSSLAELFVTTARWNRRGKRGAHVTLDAMAARGVVRQLRGRLMHERPLLIVGRGRGHEHVIALQPEPRPAVRVRDGEEALELAIPRELAAKMSESLRPERGSYRWPELPGLELEVVPLEIKDRNGKVVRVIG